MDPKEYTEALNLALSVIPTELKVTYYRSKMSDAELQLFQQTINKHPMMTVFIDETNKGTFDNDNDNETYEQEIKNLVQLSEEALGNIPEHERVKNKVSPKKEKRQKSLWKALFGSEDL